MQKHIGKAAVLSAVRPSIPAPRRNLLLRHFWQQFPDDLHHHVTVYSVASHGFEYEVLHFFILFAASAAQQRRNAACEVVARRLHHFCISFP